MSGLGESVNGDWSGDVNMNEEALQLLRTEYVNKLEFVKSIGGDGRSVEADLDVLKNKITDDVEFIATSKSISLLQ